MAANFRKYALLLAAAVCAFHLLTLRHGQGWMDDYAQYVLHARNIAEGRPYADTGYILNPARQEIGPVTYPPVFPLLLAPVYKLAGPDLQAMKALTVLFFAAFLYVLCLLFRGPLGERGALLLVALVGFSPVFWRFKDYLYADYPFLFFSFAALYTYCRTRDRELSGGDWKTFLPLPGILAYLAYGTRAAGGLLLPAFLLSDLALQRRPSKTFLAVCATALVPALAQNLSVHGDSVYFRQAGSLLAAAGLARSAGMNLLAYADNFTQLFGGGPAGAALLAALASLAAAGLAARWGRQPLLAAYALLNAALLLLFPASDGLRYAFPLVPFLFYYALEGWAEYGPRLGRPARRLPHALLAAAALSYALSYAGARFGSFAEGPEKAATGELFDFIRREVSPGTPVIFRKPRTLALYAGRPAAAYHAGEDGEVLEFFRRTGAGYVAASEIFGDDARFLLPLIARNPGSFTEVWSNSDFRVYRLK